jgi:hypothetical protein
VNVTRTVLHLTFLDTAAYRLVARQRPRDKQGVQPLLCNRQINKRPFLNNDLVNTFINDIQAIARQPSIITMEKLLEAMFCVGSFDSLYSEDPRPAE